MHTPSSKERHGGASPAVGLTDGSILLVQVCQQEHALFQHFFAAETGEQALAALLEPLCTVLYDLLRPAVVELTAVEPLCELADILQVAAPLPASVIRCSERREPSEAAHRPRPSSGAVRGVSPVRLLTARVRHPVQ
jgi:hypothetical protein